MNKLLKNQIGVGDIAYATGWTAKAFRNALERGHFVPYAEKIDDRYSFTIYDAATAAIVKQLVEFGIKTSDAFREARRVLDTHFDDEFAPDKQGMPDVVAIKAIGLFLIARQKAGEWNFKAIKTGFDRDAFGKKLLHLIDEPASLILSLHSILSPVMEKLCELGIEFDNLRYGDPVPFEIDNIDNGD